MIYATVFMYVTILNTSILSCVDCFLRNYYMNLDLLIWKTEKIKDSFSAYLNDIRIIMNHSLVSVTAFEGSSVSYGNESKQVAQTSLSAIKTGNIHIW